ncbi:FixH family protein [Lysinibacillus sp. M3]|uniref:FixH family protein n=1 Tax=Lysinibacillus zambalensis TaxID=3160866 RepID=A0ABV1MRA2_9BACI
MKKFIYIFLFTVFLFLNACSNTDTNQVSSVAEELNNIETNHIYKNGVLTTKLSVPENLRNEENFSIIMDLKMQNMDHNIEDINLSKEQNYYTAKIELPMEGIWNIDYHYVLDENTKIDSFTEVFGKVDEEQIDDVTLNITTNPEFIQPNQVGILNITLHDNQNNIIQDSKVSLQFDLLERDIHFTEDLKSENGVYQFKGKFEAGIWYVTIHAFAEGNEHLMETVILPIGTETAKEVERESLKNGHRN